MPAKKKRNRKDPAYLRKQGNRKEAQNKGINITFSLSKQIKAEGETIEEWEELNLLGKLMNRIKQVGGFSSLEARQKQYIKEYNKVSFPPDSEFTEPKHVQNISWAVMHITPKSKEVVAGYIEDDVFYIIFLDKEHKFWPMQKK